MFWMMNILSPLKKGTCICFNLFVMSLKYAYNIKQSFFMYGCFCYLESRFLRPNSILLVKNVII